MISDDIAEPESVDMAADAAIGEVQMDETWSEENAQSGIEQMEAPAELNEVEQEPFSQVDSSTNASDPPEADAAKATTIEDLEQHLAQLKEQDRIRMEQFRQEQSQQAPLDPPPAGSGSGNQPPADSPDDQPPAGRQQPGGPEVPPDPELDPPKGWTPGGPEIKG